MNSFTVTFHQEDNVDTMLVQKLTEQEFEKASEKGTRQLFELDTNIGYFIFFDAEDEDGDLSYLVFQYEENSEEPIACFSFEMKDFYEFAALYLQGMADYEQSEEEEDDEEYGPIHHLAHLLFHVVDSGEDVNPS
jgi:hypothetical protein